MVNPESIRKERDSNIELLRIICMLMVVALHILRYGPDTPDLEATISKDNLIAAFLNSFMCCAVNVFVLISGFYGMKLKVKGISSLYSSCALYGGLCYIVHLLVDDGSMSRYGIVKHTIFTLSHPRWFIGAYLSLYLLSPILNRAINSLSKRDFQKVLALLVILNVYFGWFWGGSFNTDGYNYTHFVFLYFIGRYFRIYRPMWANSKLLTASLYLGCSLVLGISAIILATTPNVWSIYMLISHGYNNPIVIIEAVALLLLFSNLNFHNHFINWIASSTLAVYLIHENPYIKSHLSSMFASLWAGWSGPLKWVYLLIAPIIIFVFCIAIDKLLTPIIKGLTSIVSWGLSWIVCRFETFISPEENYNHVK